MEKFANSGCTPIQLKKMNQFRVYLQIHTLYDISNGHVTYFDKRHHDGQQYEFCQANHSWPAQGYPGPK